MDPISLQRGKIERFYNKIKKPDVCPLKKSKIIPKLFQATQKYIEILAYDNEIQWQDFYSIIDVLNDNLKFITEKVLK